MRPELSWARRGRTSPVADLALVAGPALTWRVERTKPVLAFSQVDVIDALGASGNRFDVPGAGILYTATTPEGAFAESLARFRPKASLLEKIRNVPTVDDAEERPPPGFIDP